MRKPKILSQHRIATKNHTYHVIMEQLKNGIYGNLRWKATIMIDGIDLYSPAYVYTFEGHYHSEVEEAIWILSKHEEREV